MKFMIFILLMCGVAMASVLPVHPGGIGGLFKGPNSETIIKGPDGSVITAIAEGGEVHTKSVELEPIVVADPVESLPVLSTKIETVHIVNASPPPPPAKAVIVNEDPHIIETELVDAPDVEPDQASDLIGPSGTISTRGSKSIVSGPASTTISEPVKKIPIVPLVQTLPLVDASVKQQLVPQEAISLPIVDNLATNGVISNLAANNLVDKSAGILVSTTESPTEIILSSTAKPLLVSTIQPQIVSDLQANIDNKILIDSVKASLVPKSNQVVSLEKKVIDSTPNVNIDKVAINNDNIGLGISSTPLPVLTGSDGTNLQLNPNNIQLQANAQINSLPNNIGNQQLLLLNANNNLQAIQSNLKAINQQYLYPPIKPVNEIGLLRDTNPIQLTPTAPARASANIANAEIQNVNVESGQLSLVGSNSALVGQDPISQAVWNRYGRQTLYKE